MPGDQTANKIVQPNSTTPLQNRKRARLSRNRKLIRLYKFAKHPLFVAIFGGLLVFWISNRIQEKFTASQKQFQIEQAKRANKLTAATTAQDEIIRALSKRFIGIAALIAPYRRHFRSAKQYHEYIYYSTEAAHEWDYNEKIAKLKVRFYFTEPTIQAHWKHVVDELDKFDDAVLKLNKDFEGVTNPSDEKTRDKLTHAVESCDEILDRVDAELDSFAQELNDFIEKQEEDERRGAAQN